MNTQTQLAAVTTQELAEFKEVAAGFANDIVGADWAQLDLGDAAAIERSWSGICEIGFDRCLAAEEFGGLGLPPSALAAVIEEIATGDGGVAMLMLLSNVAAEATGETLNERERLAFLPAVGSRTRETRLPRLESGELSGAAPFALGGLGADGFVVACEADGQLALAHVERSTAGITVKTIDDQLALGAARAAQIDFDRAEAHQVGGAAEVDHAEAVLALGIAAIARGTARRARGLAQEYAENRYQGGGQIIIHGAVRDMLARMSERELGIPLAQVPPGGNPLAVGLAAKIAATDAAVESTIDAIQVFGGMGYMRETGVEKLMRDAKYCQLYPRPNWLCRDELLELQRKAA